MKREFIFIDASYYYKNGVDYTLFKNTIDSFTVYQSRYYRYVENNKVKVIEVPTDKILIIGYYE